MSPRHYLDHASTSPLRPQAARAMMTYLSTGGIVKGEDPRDVIGDAARIYHEGQLSRNALEGYREEVARWLGARPRQVVFTSGATEAIHHAVWAAAQMRPGRPMVGAAIEHSSVRAASARLARWIEVPVDGKARIDIDALEAILTREQPAVVHCQAANHEVGTLQPVREVVELCHERSVLVHVDAASAASHVPLDIGTLDADLVSISSHKVGGPLGAGALVIRRGLRIPALFVGSTQERGRRAGIENLPAIAGFAATSEFLGSIDGTDQVPQQEREAARAQQLTKTILEAVTKLPGVQVYGDPLVRAPHITCFGAEDVVAEAIVLGLDRRGVSIHSGSACSSEGFEPSPVLAAMGADADHSLRVSVGWSTLESDIDAFLTAFPEVLAELRSLRGNVR